MSEVASAALQQLIREVSEHRNMTEQEMDAIADILQKFGQRLVALEATVDRLEKLSAQQSGTKSEGGL